MKLGMALLVASFLAVGAGAANAQTIDIVGDSLALSCSGTFMPPAPYPFPRIHIIARVGPPVASGITGAEFFVDGWPAGWSKIVTPNPANTAALGDPLAPVSGVYRANIAFPCQSFVGGFIILYSVEVIATTVVPETYLQVVVANPPTNPVYTTPIVTACDAPDYTAFPAQGGAFIMNGRDCSVGVESKTWGQVKSLFGG